MRKDPDHEERNHKSNSETPGQPGSKEGKTEVTFILTNVSKEGSSTCKRSMYGACMVIQKENAHPNRYYWVTHTVTMNFLIYPTVTMQYKIHKTQPVVSKYQVFEDQLRLWDTTPFAVQCCFSGPCEPCSLGWAALPQLASSWKWDRSRWTWGDFGEMRAELQDLEKVIDDYREADTQFIDGHLSGLGMSHNIRCTKVNPTGSLQAFRYSPPHTFSVPYEAYLTSSVSFRPYSHLTKDA